MAIQIRGASVSVILSEGSKFLYGQGLSTHGEVVLVLYSLPVYQHQYVDETQLPFKFKQKFKCFSRAHTFSQVAKLLPSLQLQIKQSSTNKSTAS